MCVTASCHMGRSHDIGGLTRWSWSILHVEENVLFWQRTCALQSHLLAELPTPPSVLDTFTACPQQQHKHDPHAQYVAHFSAPRVCVKLAEAPPLPGIVYCPAAAGGARGEAPHESGQETFFNRIFPPPPGIFCHLIWSLSLIAPCL